MKPRHSWQSFASRGLLAVLLGVACEPSSPSSTSQAPRPAKHDSGQDHPQPAPWPPEPPEGMKFIPEGGTVDFRHDARIYFPFFADVNETTVAEYQACVVAGACSPADASTWNKSKCTADKPGKDDYPVSCVDYVQASRYCRWRGKRLPTAAEWMWAAQGGEVRMQPWGDAPLSCEYANSGAEPRGCGFEGPWPVGHAPRGATKHGLNDMVGNLAEFVSTPSRQTNRDDMSAGTSWWTKPEQCPLKIPFHSGGLGTSSHQKGFRCFKDAVTKPVAPAGMRYIEDGGTVSVLGKDEPVGKPFFVDRTETSVADYRACIGAGGCTASHGGSSPTQVCTQHRPGDPQRPINCVDHAQAAAYCTWRGKQLPTVAQWRWVAQETHEHRPYPWGSALPLDCDLANIYAEPRNRLGCGYAGPWPVGTISDDSMLLVHDLVGNVSEWTSSTGDTPTQRLHVGRSWREDDIEKVRAHNLIAAQEASAWSDQLGVRCVSPAPGIELRVPEFVEGLDALPALPVARDLSRKYLEEPQKLRRKEHEAAP